MNQDPNLIPEVAKVSYLCFKLKGEKFAVKSEFISDIIEVPTITKLPGAPGYMRGVIYFQNNAVPVLDLRLIQGFSKMVISVNTILILFRVIYNDQCSLFGALVDSIEEIMELGLNRYHPQPDAEGKVRDINNIEIKILNPQKMVPEKDYLLIDQLILRSGLNQKR
jgi:purine-binding chemotaxis protein CheW